MAYQWAAGYDNEAGFAAFDPQPATNGIIEGRITRGADLMEYIDGYARTSLRFTSITEAELADLLSDLSLDDAASVKITVSVRTNDDRSTFANYNAIIYRPHFSQGGGEFPTLRTRANDVVFELLLVAST